MKTKLLTTTALIFAAAAAPAVANERPVITSTGTFNTGEVMTCTSSQSEQIGDDCYALGGDASPRIALMERLGATSATFKHVFTYMGKSRTSTGTTEKRADGTWLMTNKNDGGDWGAICTSAPVKCVQWQEGTAKTKAKATRKAKAAARR
jgi:hypothetical protein